jgi:hypothetical protein
LKKYLGKRQVSILALGSIQATSYGPDGIRTFNCRSAESLASDRGQRIATLKTDILRPKVKDQISVSVAVGICQGELHGLSFPAVSSKTNRVGVYGVCVKCVRSEDSDRNHPFTVWVDAIREIFRLDINRNRDDYDAKQVGNRPEKIRAEADMLRNIAQLSASGCDQQSPYLRRTERCAKVRYRDRLQVNSGAGDDWGGTSTLLKKTHILGKMNYES